MDSKKIKTSMVGLTILVVLLGMMMRSPITTIPLIINQLAEAMKVQAGSLGILTSLPLLMFMVFANFASPLLKRLGFKKSLVLAVTIILLGSILRLVVTMPTVILGTAMIGMGIAYLNVFMPAFVAAYFSNKIGLYTTLYTFAMMGGNAVFNVLTAPIATHFGWWMVLVVLILIPLLSLLIWLSLFKNTAEKITETHPARDAEVQPAKTPIWTNKKAWLFMMSFGSQSVIAYTIMAWLPAVMDYHKVNPAMVGITMAMFSIMGLLASVFLPQLLTTLHKNGQIVLMLTGTVTGLIAAVMFMFPNTSNSVFWLFESIFIGYAVNLFFVFEMTMFAIKTTNPYDTARLSGMAQSGGYLLAALGPMLFGWAFSANPTGMVQNIFYVGLIILVSIGSISIIKMKEIS